MQAEAISPTPPVRSKQWLQAAIALRWQILLGLVLGAAPGHFLVPFIVGKRGMVIDNRLLEASDRLVGVIVVAASLLLSGLAFAGYRFLRKRGEAEEAWGESLRRWNLGCLPLLGLPLAGALAAPKVETSHPWLVIFVALALAAITVVFVYRLPLRSMEKVRGAGIAVGLLVVAYGLLFSFFSLRQHHAFGTHTFDLGIYNHLFWNNLHGKWLASTLVRGGVHWSAHFDPILILLTPIYAINPRAETILILQSFWLALGAVPLYFLAKKKLENPWLGVGLALVFLLYPAMHGVNLYDFHSLALAAPLLLAMLASLELRANRVYWVMLGLALLVREDVSLMVFTIGLYAGVALGRWRVGGITMGVALLYLLAVKLFIMPDPGLLMRSSGDIYGYSYYYRDLMGKEGSRVSDMVASLIANPVYLLKLVFNEAKLRYFALLFVPLLFVPLLAGRRAIVMLYGFAFLFLSSRTQVHSIHFQYTTVLYPFAMAMLPIVLADLRSAPRTARILAHPGRLPRALIAGSVVAALALGAKFGPLLPNDSFMAGFTPFVYRSNPATKEELRWLDETLDSLPEDASISVTSKLGGHATRRTLVYHFGRESDYLLVHRKDLGPRNRRRMSELRAAGYRVIDEHGNLQLLAKKVEEPEKAPENPHAVPPEDHLRAPSLPIPRLEESDTP